MIIVGFLLAILGYFINIYILEVLGIILIVLGVLLWFVPVGGHTRRWY